MSLDDDSWTPSFICRLCQRKLERWNRQKTQKKMAKINIDTIQMSCPNLDAFWNFVKAEGDRLKIDLGRQTCIGIVSRKISTFSHPYQNHWTLSMLKCFSANFCQLPWHRQYRIRWHLPREIRELFSGV